VIGTNKPDAIATVRCMLADLPGLQAPAGLRTDPEAVPALLSGKGVRFVSFPDWKRLDALEVQRGQAVGKPREKYTSVDEMLAALK
jgi:ferredoxin/flavodoxin---NADP+ reductase